MIESLIGISLIAIGAITLMLSIRNVRQTEGFSLVNGGMNMLYVSIALVSVGTSLVIG